MRLLLALAVIAVLACPSSAADPAPAWLLERTERLTNIRTGDPAHADTLLVLAGELADHDQPGRAARVMEQAGIQSFRCTDLDRAVSIWQDGLNFAREHGDRQRESGLLNALAVGYSVTDRVGEAITAYGQSLSLKTALGDTVGVGRTWGNLAAMYNQVGRLAEAMDANAEATRWGELTGNLSVQVTMQLNRAAILNELARYHEALQLVDLSLARLDTLDMPDERGIAHLQRLQSLAGLGRYEAALIDADAAIHHLDAAGGAYYALFPRQWRVELLRLLHRHDEAKVALEKFSRALDDGEVTRLRTVQHLYQGLLALDEDRPDDALAVLEQAVAGFEARRDEHDDDASRAGLFHGSGDVYGALGHARLAVGDTLGAWRITEQGQALLFRERLGGSSVAAGLTEVQQVLADADAVFVQACETRTEPLIWFVITPDRLTAVTAGDPGELAADARAALSHLAAGDPVTACEAPLSRLGRALLTPLAPWLSGEVPRVYMVGPSTLAGLPLCVLPLPDGRRLGEQVALSYVPSATALAMLQAHEPVPDGMLAMGDPRTSNVAMAGAMLPTDPLRRTAAMPLPEARREVQRVAGNGAEVLLGEEARLSALRAGAGDVAVIHLASHAVSDPLDGARSSILLAADSADAGPAVLTAAAAESLSLRADLTVLSACRSGMGHALLGEGSFGLPRSLLLAGSRSVVSSLWDVEDRAARRFMEAFYAELRGGVARDEALRRAASRLARSGAPPRDWAAFVLTGVGHEPVSSLVGSQARWRLASPSLIWFGGFLVMMLVGVAVRRRRREQRP